VLGLQVRTTMPSITKSLISLSESLSCLHAMQIKVAVMLKMAYFVINGIIINKS
jgi:hypothetical protein